LYAICLKWSPEPLLITSLPISEGKVKKISLLGSTDKLKFTQNEQGLKIMLPKEKITNQPFTLKIEGINLSKTVLKKTK
jgi:alpha-L-fucosidase